MSDPVAGAMRNCTGCGKPLSRYNTGKCCQACVSTGRNASLSRRDNDRFPLVDGARLAQLRHDRGWTQEILADYAGLSRELVRKLEQGARKSARLGTLNALAQALNIAVSVLLAGNRADEPFPEPAPPHATISIDQADEPPVSEPVRELTPTLQPETRQPELPAGPDQTTLLRALAIERRWHRFKTFEAQFQRAVRELAEHDGDPQLAKLTISSRQWERWNAGDIKTEPHPDAARVLEHMFGYPVQQLLATNQLSGSTSTDDATETGARNLIAWLEATNISDEVIDYLAKARVTAAEDHISLPPTMMLPKVQQLHAMIATVLQGGKQRLSQTRELLRLDAELLAHLCQLHGDVHSDRTAFACGRAAIALADEAGSSPAAAFSAQAQIARWRGRHAEAADLAAEGLKRGAPTSLRTLLAYQEATAAAAAGDRRRAHAAIACAEAIDNSEAAPDSVWSCPPGRQALYRIGVELSLGHPQESLQLAANTALWQSRLPRAFGTWAHFQIAVAKAHLMLGSVEGAAEQLTPVLSLSEEYRLATVVEHLMTIDLLLRQQSFDGSVSAAALHTQIVQFREHSASPAA
jgi:transcriptional regulator with XRE-family HTH domain